MRGILTSMATVVRVIKIGIIALVNEHGVCKDLRRVAEDKSDVNDQRSRIPNFIEMEL